MAITIRDREIKAGNNQPFEILSGDSSLIIGISGRTTTVPGVSEVLVDGVNATYIIGTNVYGRAWVELWYIHAPHVGAAIVVGFTANDATNVAICVWKCNGVKITSPVRGTGAAADTNDYIVVTADSDPRDTVFYLGKKRGATTGGWSGVTNQTAAVENTVGADEAGSSPTADGTYGSSGDDSIVGVGASMKRGTRRGGRVSVIA